MSAPGGWDPLVDDLEPLLSPEWTRHAREHGAQGWIRLVLLVDAHSQLSSPRVAEKVAMTMVDLAGEREREAAGWNAIIEKARDDRLALVARLVDASADLLSEELHPLFLRSIEPLARA